VPQVALAQSPPAEAESPAKAAYRAGVEHFKKQQFADAIREFNKAYRLDPNPVLVFNMARAFEELKQYASAIEYYKRYLEMAPQAPDRAKVEDSLRALEILQKAAATEAKVMLTVTSVPDGAKVLVDGREVGVTPLKAEVPAGHRYLAVEAPGYTRHSSELDVDAVNPPSAHIVLVPQPAGPAPAPAAGGMTRDAWAYIALGLGGALLVGGGIAGWQASKKADKLDQIEANPRPTDKPEYDTLKSDGKTFALVADGLFVGSALAVGTGLILLFTGGQPEAPEGSPSGGTVAPAAGWSF
jgi:tetratricopeptide (TPR) repeat protein